MLVVPVSDGVVMWLCAGAVVCAYAVVYLFNQVNHEVSLFLCRLINILK